MESGSASPVGGGGHALQHQPSMMETVRHRLETTPQIDVAGVDPRSRTGKDASSPRPSPPQSSSPGSSYPKNPNSVIQVRQKRKTRFCCGREVKIRFLSLLLISITSVMVLTMIAQLLTQVFTSFSISDNLIDICANSTGTLLAQLELGLYSGLNRYGRVFASAVTSDLVLNFFGQAQSQLGAFSNFVVASGINPAITMGPGLSFMAHQALASYSDQIDLMGFGGTTGPSNNVTDVYYSVSVCDLVDTNVTASCIPTVMVLINGVLQRCPIVSNVPQNVLDSCAPVGGFNLSSQVPYVNQLRQPASSTAVLLWSQLYVLDNGYQVFIPGQAAQNSTAISLSYPVFPAGCTTYSCIQGVAWTSITSRALATYSLGLLKEMAAGVEDGQNPFLNNTAMYFANHLGQFVAGAWNEADLGVIIPDQVGLAENVASSSAAARGANPTALKQIADSAKFITGYFPRGFADSQFEEYTVQFYINGTEEVCPDLQWDNCSLLIAQSATPESTLPLFQSPNAAETRLISVVTVSTRNLLAFFDSSQQLVNYTIQQQEEAQDLVLNSIGIGAAIAVVAVLCGVLVSMIVAIKITEPLSKIEKEMQRLVRFKLPKDGRGEGHTSSDEDDGEKYYSRVVEVNKAEKVMEKLETSIEVFSKFVPSTVVRGIVQGKPQASQLHVAPCEVTVAFSDIKGFTTISERLETTDLLFLLTRYLTVMTEVIEIYEGTVTEILGDGLLVIWNAPDKCELHCAKAAACALAMQVAVAALCVEFQPLLLPLGLEDFSIRVGIHSGRVLAGNIGSNTKLKYGCIGDAVNTASRLEGLCKLYQVGIICSQDTFDQFPKHKFQTRRLDLVQVKGKDIALGLYEVQSLNETVGNEYYDPSSPSNGHEPQLPPAGSSGAELFRPTLSVLRKIPLLSNLPMLKPASTEVYKKKRSESSNLAFGPIASLLTLTVPQEELNETYEEALEAFQTADFARAEELLVEIEARDAPSKLLLARVYLAQKEVIDPLQWTGANRLTEKF